jgi:U3 small nucleolar ribonucleoprotein protein IMP4
MSVRRNSRLRREYLYRKSLSGKEQETYEKKRVVKKALAEGKPIPTEMKNDYQSIQKSIDYDDAETEMPKNMLDDEYARSGIYDPKVLLTTARDPSSRLLAFAKELNICIPNSQRINRGGTILKELMDACRRDDITDVVIVHEHRGEPDGMVVCHLPYGPTAYFGLHNTVLRHDLPKRADQMSEAYPHLIFHNFKSTLGKRTSTILQHLFPVPKDESRRALSIVNQNDIISFRHHVYKSMGHKEVELKEVGPRFEMKLYQIKLGTIEMTEAESEWVLRPYMNTAKKRKALG